MTFKFLKKLEILVMIIDIVSDVYQNLKIKGYDLLEKRNWEVVRKLNPCPKQYKTWGVERFKKNNLSMLYSTHLQCHRLEAFDADVKELVEKYQALPPEAQSSELLLDFETRWRCSKERLAQRLSRRRVWILYNHVGIIMIILKIY